MNVVRRLRSTATNFIGMPTSLASNSTPPTIAAAPSTTPPLTFRVTAKCSTSKARVGLMKLRHSDVQTPVFMPVGTQGTLKGILPDQLENINCQIILANTYHLGMRPVSVRINNPTTMRTRISTPFGIS